MATVLSSTCILTSYQTLFRGYRQTCGIILHARSRETVAEGRMCDTSKGLVCAKHGVCECSSGVTVHGHFEHVVWNRTHCVVRINETCRIHQSYYNERVTELPEVFSNVPKRVEELFCGRGAECTDEGSCKCTEGFHEDSNDLNCISDSSSGQLKLGGNDVILGITGVVLMTRLTL